MPHRHWAFGGIACLILLPLAGVKDFVLHLSTLVLLWTMLCVSLNVIFGYAGQLSLAHGGLFGIGAYVYGVLATKLGINFWIAFPLGGLIAGRLGY